MKFTAQQLKAINHTRGNLQLVTCAALERPKWWPAGW